MRNMFFQRTAESRLKQMDFQHRIYLRTSYPVGAGMDPEQILKGHSIMWASSLQQKY